MGIKTQMFKITAIALNANKQKNVVKALCFLCALILAPTGCGKQNVNDWTVELKLKPKSDETYLAVEDPEIKALITKHGIAFRQTYPAPKSTPELILVQGKSA